jgi:hypothetical protein
MAITVELTAEQEAELAEEAARRRVTPAEYARQLIEEGMRPRQSLAEFLAPFRRQVEASGLTDEELDDLIENAREEVYREQRQAHAR